MGLIGAAACAGLPDPQSPTTSLPKGVAAAICASPWDLHPNGRWVLWLDGNTLVQTDIASGSIVSRLDARPASGSMLAYDPSGHFALLVSVGEQETTLTRVDLASQDANSASLPPTCRTVRWGPDNTQTIALCGTLTVQIVDWNAPAAAPRVVSPPALGIAPQQALNNSTPGPTIDGTSRRVAINYLDDNNDSRLSVWSFAGAAAVLTADITNPESTLYNTILPTANAQSIAELAVYVAFNPRDTNEFAPYGFGLFTMTATGTPDAPLLTRMLSAEGVSVATYTQDGAYLVTTLTDGHIAAWGLRGGQNPLFLSTSTVLGSHIATTAGHRVAACTRDGNFAVWQLP